MAGKIVPPDRCTDAAPCKMRHKIVLTPYSLPQEACGIADSEVADFLIFDEKSPHGRPMLTFRFCPWCGAPWLRTGKTHEVQPPPPVEEGEEWKKESDGL